MDLDELRAFVAVVEAGSLASAARSLGFARATLSRRIDELEARTGVPLLERTRSGAVPTPAGVVMAQQGKRVLQDASTMLRRVRSVSSDPAGMLHLMVFQGVPPTGIALATRWLREQHPSLSFEIQSSASPLTEVLEGIDVVIYIDEPGASPGPSWATRVLRPVPQRLLASESYLDARGVPESPKALAEHDLLLWQKPGPPVRHLSVGGAIVDAPPVVVSPDIHGLIEMARAGLGIACVPEGGLVPTGPGELVPVLPNEDAPTYQLAIATTRSLAGLPRINTLMEALEAAQKLFVG